MELLNTPTPRPIPAKAEPISEQWQRQQTSHGLTATSWPTKPDMRSPRHSELVFHVAHNLAKLEMHSVDGSDRMLCVHRKGATRAFGPGHPDTPSDLRAVGQPVLLPGSMGTASWVLRGVAGNPAFDSSAHGAGRLMSRGAARRRASGTQVRRDLEQAGISIGHGSAKLLAEEAPYAYKDVDEVAHVCEVAVLAARVARLRPLGVVKA